MPLLISTVLAAFGAAFAGRAAVLAGQLSGALGRNAALLALCWLSAGIASAAAAGCGALGASILEPTLGSAVAVLILAAAIAGLWRPAVAPPILEPTRSLGAMALVLLVRQAADPARLAVAALALATGEAAPAAVAGTLASGAALTIAWNGRPGAGGRRARWAAGAGMGAALVFIAVRFAAIA